MCDSGSEQVTISCPDHHSTLVNGLWNLFLRQEQTDLNIGAGTTSVVRLHKQVVNGLMSTERLIEYVLFTGSHNLDPIVEFLYRGTATLPRNELDCTLQVARELEFTLLADSVASSSVNGTQLVTITSSNHHQLLVDGLWKAFLAAQIEKSSIQPTLIMKLFLSAMKLQDFTSSNPLHNHTIDSLISAMFTGTVTVASTEVKHLLVLARRLKFRMLVDAIECTQNKTGSLELEVDSGIQIGDVWSCNVMLESGTQSPESSKRDTTSECNVVQNFMNQTRMDIISVEEEPMEAEPDVSTLHADHKTVQGDRPTSLEVTVATKSPPPSNHTFAVFNCTSMSFEEGSNAHSVSGGDLNNSKGLNVVALGSKGQTSEPMETAIARLKENDFSDFGRLVAKVVGRNSVSVVTRDAKALCEDTVDIHALAHENGINPN